MASEPQVVLGTRVWRMAPSSVLDGPENPGAQERPWPARSPKTGRMAALPLGETAFFLLTSRQRRALLGGAGLLCFLCALWPGPMLRAGIVLLTALYAADVLLTFFLALRSLRRAPEIRVSPTELRWLPPTTLPRYTILCPLFREARIVPQFIRAMRALRYPADRLQILLLLEEHDVETQAAIAALQLSLPFQVVIVPRGVPQTKPRACNLGLRRASGEFLVIYDAEDIPETDQLLKAVAAFRKVPYDVVCLQAKLDFYNPRQNLLTRLFTAEYAALFSLVLPGLQSIGGPIPLGGTSNHFRTAALRETGGWDPFNVTEDCDLGIRLFSRGFRTAILDSATFEEANSRLPNWVRQRSRWMKGYLQTLCVHVRAPRRFFRSPRMIRHLATFVLIVGWRTIASLINPFLWLLTLTYIVGPERFRGAVEFLYPSPVLYAATASFLFGSFLAVLQFIIGVWQRRYPDLVKVFPFVILYWPLQSVAAWKAFAQLLRRPHFWEKTVHGFHLQEERRVSPTEPLPHGHVREDLA
jgi:glycosyltransferase XagB